MPTGTLRWLFILLAVILQYGCAGGDVKPLTAGDAEIGSDEDEVRLFSESAKAHKELMRRGLILEDDVLSVYLNEVVNRLQPEGLAGVLSIQVYVVRDPVVNAFAFPNGSIYINSGLLERLDNEAQLAHVLAHELAHVIQRHGLSGYKSRKAKIIAANITDLVLLGTSIAYIPYIASMSSYSRSHEKEADEMALRMMSAAGYPLTGAEELFKVIEEVKIQESVSASIYSSHPDNGYRAAYSRDLIQRENIAVNRDAPDNARNYSDKSRHLSIETIKLRLLNKHYELARDAADRGLIDDADNPWLYYYRGESFRLMAGDPKGTAREYAYLYGRSFNDDLVDEKAAVADRYYADARSAYQKALLAEDGFAHAYRGLGLIAMAQGDYANGRDFLNYYLEHAGQISDRRYIERILKTAERGNANDE